MIRDRASDFFLAHVEIATSTTRLALTQLLHTRAAALEQSPRRAIEQHRRSRARAGSRLRLRS